MEKATFGAGCFWGPEEKFANLTGVKKTEVGYMGGDLEEPTYEQVCSGTTGHIEVVNLEFDPKKISYEELVRFFFSIHDPTQKDRQGPDIGTQYRSVIFYHSVEQKDIAEKVKNEIESDIKKENKVMHTEIKPAQKFYRAEEYHQSYLKKKGKSVC